MIYVAMKDQVVLSNSSYPIVRCVDTAFYSATLAAASSWYIKKKTMAIATGVWRFDTILMTEHH